MRAFLERVSPLGHADKIHTPILVVQGQNDPRVPISEAEQMVAALKKNGSPLWYVVGTNEGHGFAKKVNQDYLQGRHRHVREAFPGERGQRGALGSRPRSAAAQPAGNPAIVAAGHGSAPVTTCTNSSSHASLVTIYHSQSPREFSRRWRPKPRHRTSNFRLAYQIAATLYSIGSTGEPRVGSIPRTVAQAGLNSRWRINRTRHEGGRFDRSI